MSANSISPAASRRRWLEQAALLSVGGLLVAKATAQDADSDQAARKRFLDGTACHETECPQIVKVSKILEGEMQLSPAKSCLCHCDATIPAQIIARTCYRAILPLQPNRDCDESEREPLLQGGSELWLSGKLTLREGECRQSGASVLVGRNEGLFRIHRYRPNEDVLAAAFCGTVGQTPLAQGETRCCAAGHGLGTYSGAGFNSLDGWSLCASYHWEIEQFPNKAEALCRPQTLKFKIYQLDGVLVGPCKPIEGSGPAEK